MAREELQLKVTRERSIRGNFNDANHNFDKDLVSSRQDLLSELDFIMAVNGLQSALDRHRRTSMPVQTSND